MERTVYILCCLLMIAGTTYAQQQNCNITWGQPIMVSDASVNSYTPVIAISGDDTIHITWGLDGDYKLPYVQSSDGGNSFGAIKEMLPDSNAFPTISYRPFIIADGDNVFLFFINITYSPVRLLISTDRGNNWSYKGNIKDDLASSIISASVLGGTLIVEYPNKDGFWRFLVSTNMGRTWETLYDENDGFTRMALTPGVIHLVKHVALDGSSAGEVLYLKSDNMGRNWRDSVLLSSNDNIFSDLQEISSYSNGNLSEMWTAWRDEKYGIYGYLGASIIARCKVGNIGWQPEQLLTDQPQGIISSLSSNARNHAIAIWYEEVAGESTQIVVRATNSSLNAFCPMENITPHKYTGDPPMVKVTSHAVHVVWEQLDEDGRFHIYYRKGEFDTTKSQFMMADTSVSFDPTVISTFRNKWVTLSNTGSDELYIGTILPNDSNFAVTPTSLSISAGDSAEIKVSFTPKSSGTKEGKIVLYHSGANSPDVIPLSGEGIEWKAVIGSWNLISTPFNLDAGFSLPLLYAWDSMYVQSDNMVVGKGYWAKLSSPVVYTGTAVMEDTINVRTGWNVIGALALPIATGSAIADPVDNIASSFFGYTGGRYTPTDTLKPGYGYWVKAKQGGKIILKAIK